MHQQFKRYARNSGFKNVGLTIAKKFQKYLCLNYSNRIHPTPNENSFVKNNVLFKCSKNTIVAFKENGFTKIGALESFFGEKVFIRIHNARFNATLLFWEIINTDTELTELNIMDIIDSVGHIYEYGIEPDIIQVIMFKYPVQY